MSRTQAITQVDAFADRPFAGNPAAVCILDRPAPESWMRAVAREMNLSETAFLHPEGAEYRLRWFTPAVEVDLCGHATLAGAHVLWEEGRLAPDQPVRFQTRSGLLTAWKRGELIEMDFPAKPVEPRPEDSTRGLVDGLAQALGCPVVFAAFNAFDCLVEVESESALRNIRPDFGRLVELPVRGVIVTSLAESTDSDFVSRFFAPRAGVSEDPVTGSAHCCLGPYWAAKLGRANFRAYQASERGGVVQVRVEGDRVWLGGRAVTVLKGTLAEAAGPQDGTEGVLGR
jgi:PhzF family phenazine biosynthesis protein